MLEGCGEDGKSEWKRETLLQESGDELVEMRKLISRRRVQKGTYGSLYLECK